MSKFNKIANDPKFRSIVQEWVRHTSPLLYVYAPSNEGKTTLLGSLFPREPSISEKVPLWTYEHADYAPVLYIDADQGSTTIEHLTQDPALCDLREFDQAADQQLAWMYSMLDLASRAECGAIIIEGLTSVHDRLVANELRKNPSAVGNTLRRSYIGPSSHAKGLIDSVRQVKQNRIASKRGVPIIVTLNTKSRPIDPDKPDSGTQHVPDWSNNLIDKAMRGSDGHVQLMRDAAGTRLITMKSAYSPYCKMRSADVAEAVQREINLSLPGLLTLWAVTIQKKAELRREAVDKRQSADHNNNPTGSTTTGA